MGKVLFSTWTWISAIKLELRLGLAKKCLQVQCPGLSMAILRPVPVSLQVFHPLFMKKSFTVIQKIILAQHPRNDFHEDNWEKEKVSIFTIRRGKDYGRLY